MLQCADVLIHLDVKSINLPAESRGGRPNGSRFILGIHGHLRTQLRERSTEQIGLLPVMT